MSEQFDIRKQQIQRGEKIKIKKGRDNISSSKQAPSYYVTKNIEYAYTGPYSMCELLYIFMGVFLCCVSGSSFPGSISQFLTNLGRSSDPIDIYLSYTGSLIACSETNFSLQSHTRKRIRYFKIKLNKLPCPLNIFGALYSSH